MSLPGERPDEQEIAVGLAQAVMRALEPGAGALDLKAARDVSQILVLDGLDRVLRHFEPHLGRQLPVELAAVRDRLLRMAMRAMESGDIHEFRVTGAELEALAGDLGAIEWSGAGDMGRDVATVTASRALEDLPGAASDSAAGATRLTAPVAARLRASLDWLAGARGFTQPLVLRADDSLFEVWCANVDPSGLGPARQVLADVDGLIGPSLAGRGGWLLRVPAVAARDHFLMIERGGIRVALPWHAVLRLQVLPADAIDARAAEAGFERIDPLPFANPSSRERPVVTVGHGARRAWLAADRLVWRLAAMPAAPDDAMRGAGFDRAVRTEEDELYAVAPLARWLEHVVEPVWPMEREMPATPEPAATPAAPPTLAARTPLELTSAAVTAVPTAPEPNASVTPAAAPAAAPGLRVFRPIRIETDIIAPEPRTTPAAPALVVAPSAPAAVSASRTPAVAALTESAVATLPAPPAPAPHVAAAAPRAAAPRVVTPELEPAPRVVVPEPEPAPRLLSIFHVEPLAAPAAPVAPPIAPARAEVAPPLITPAPTRVALESLPPAAARVEPSPEPLPRTSGSPRRALVAVDSLMARIFLTKQLEQAGLAVTAVTRAAELDDALRAGTWSLILADVELSDARGDAFMRALRQRALEADFTPLVALVRDREDRAIAESAGVLRQLRKPVEPEALRGVLRSLALLPQEPA